MKIWNVWYFGEWKAARSWIFRLNSTKISKLYIDKLDRPLFEQNQGPQYQIQPRVPTSHNPALVMPLIYIVEWTGVWSIKKAKLRCTWFPTTSPPKCIQNFQLFAENCQNKNIKNRGMLLFIKRKSSTLYNS